MSEKQDPLNGDFFEPEPGSALTDEGRLHRIIVRTVAVTVVTIAAIVGGCTAHSNTFDAERLVEKAKIVAEETKAEIAISQAKLAKVEALERMVADGANPVAIHCMMEGWNNSNTTCMVVGLSLGKELPKE